MYSVSPDGRRLAYIERSESGQQDVRVLDIKTGSSLRVTNGEALFMFPIWNEKGDFIVVGSLRAGLFLVNPNGDRSAQPLVPSSRVLRPMGFRSGDTHLAYIDMTGAFTLKTVPIEHIDGEMRAGRPTPFLPPDSIQRSASFSPDGKWIAYETTENGHPMLHAQQFPKPGRKFPISKNAGTRPVWLNNEIRYLSGGKIMSVTCTIQGNELTFQDEKVWRPDLAGVTWFSTDARGTSVSVLQVAGHSDHVFRYIPNFADELRRRVR
jgi:serine/threonine-protein kinase